MRNRREAALKAWETIRAKKANSQSEFQAFCEVVEQEEKEYKKELRKAIIKIGGVWDKDFENVPVSIKRKNGVPLDEMVIELQGFGYNVQDSNDLFRLIEGALA